MTQSKFNLGLIAAILMALLIWGSLGYVIFHFASKWFQYRVEEFARTPLSANSRTIPPAKRSQTCLTQFFAKADDENSTQAPAKEEYFIERGGLNG